MFILFSFFLFLLFLLFRKANIILRIRQYKKEKYDQVRLHIE
jgi:hypothetical protein